MSAKRIPSLFGEWRLLAHCLVMALIAMASPVYVAAAQSDSTKKADESGAQAGEKKEDPAHSPKDAKADEKEGDAAHKDGDHKDGDHKDGDHKEGADGAHQGDGDHGSGGHGGHGHDETDLGHANAGDSLEVLHEVRPELAIYTLIVFIILLVILRAVAWNPIMDGLAKREQSIADMIAEAKANAEAAEKRAAEYETKLQQANEEARELVAEARRDAEATRERLLAEAEAARQADRERFQTEIETAKTSALSEVARKGAEIAVQLAGQIVRREVRPDDHAQLISDALERFPSNN